MWSYFSTQGRACFSTTVRRSVRTRSVRFMLPSPARAQPSTISLPSSQPRAARNARTPSGSPASSQGNSGWACIASRRTLISRLAVPRRSALRAQLRLYHARALWIGNVVAVARVLPGDHRRSTGAPPEQLPTLVAHARAAHRRPRRLERRVLAARERLDLLRDAHAAPVVPAHGAEVGVDLEVLVMERAGSLPVERELELPRPVECRAGTRQVVVPLARAGHAARDVAGVRRDLVRDAARLHVLG